MTKKKSLLMVLAMVCMVITIGCSKQGADLGVEQANDGITQDETSTQQLTELKIGLMPAVDTAPILVAQDKGYFEKLGLDVEIEIYSNAQNRQSALQSNQIDGAMTDFIAVATNVDGGFNIKATTMTDGMFPVLSHEGATEKKDIKVGMMEVSVSNYLIDQWLGADYNIEKVYINEIPARLAAIASKELDMGLFPEPVATNGELQGLIKNIYGLEDEYSPDCMVFTQKAIEEKSDAIVKFHEAYNQAVRDINEDESIARDILIAKIPNIAPEAKELMVLPVFKEAALPSTDYLDEIINWTSETLNKSLSVTGEDLVERQFVN